MASQELGVMVKLSRRLLFLVFFVLFPFIFAFWVSQIFLAIPGFS